MGVIKVDPFRGFDSMLRRVNDFYEDVNRGGIRFEVGDFQPRVDVSEDATSVTIHAELPGIQKEDVKITITDQNVITIRGEKKRETKSAERNFMRIERSYGAFTRSFTLPDNLKHDAVSAAFDSGVLTITIPKAEPTRPKEQEISIS